MSFAGIHYVKTTATNKAVGLMLVSLIFGIVEYGFDIPAVQPSQSGLGCTAQQCSF
jgi:hypothetical protein